MKYEGDRFMTNSYSKYSRFKAKVVNGGVLFGLFLLISACSTPQVQPPAQGTDAPHSFSSKAQEAWESKAFTATSDYHFGLGQGFALEGKVDRAIEEYRAALAYDDNSSLIHSRLAAEYLKKGNTSFAIDECKRAIELDSDASDVRIMLGGIYSMNNESDLALAQYDAVLKKQSNNDEAAVFKTQVLAEKGNVSDAVKFIRAFTAKTRDSAAAWFYAGKLEFATNNVTAAIKDYRVALELRPGFSQATLALGMIFETHNEFAKAKEIYEAQMEEKQDVQIASRLATLYLKANQLDAGLKVLTIMRAMDSEDLNTEMKIGLIYMQKQDWKNAKDAFQEILVKVPDSDRVHYYMAAVFEEENNLQGSIDHLLKVNSDSKLFEDASMHAAGLYRKLSEKEKSYGVLQDAIKKSPENPGFYVALASLYEDDQNVPEAMKSLEAGLKIFPDHEKMTYFHAALLDKEGKQDEAVTEMEIVLKKNPENADALNYVAYTWTTQGVHLKDAEDLLKRALKLKPDSPFILDSMGWNQFMMGKNKDAIVFLEKAVSLKSDEQAILEHLVEVYSRNQMNERAQATKSRIRALSDKTVDKTGDKAARMPSSVNED
jgi:tetratricopeptide (TPR) repeat protein